MTIPYDVHVRVPQDVLVSELEGESVLLNLKTEVYFGLDQTGTRIWTELTKGGTIQDAYDRLCAEYDVDPERLRADLDALLEKLFSHELLAKDQETAGANG
jgi:hypothetical protein